MTYAERVYESVKAKNPNEPEFLQAVKEVLESLAPVFEKKPEWMIRAKCRLTAA